jgi:hypothetical protein
MKKLMISFLFGFLLLFWPGQGIADENNITLNALIAGVNDAGLIPVPADTIYETEPNNSIAEANSIVAGRYVCGTITDVYNDLDYYMLNVTGPTKLSVVGALGDQNTYNNYSQYLTVELMDGAGQVLATSVPHTMEYGNCQLLEKNIIPGTYYIVTSQIHPSKSFLVGKTCVFKAYFSGAYVPVSNVQLNYSNLTMVKGSSQALTATVEPLNATDQSMTWSSSEPGITGVSSNGLVTAKEVGSAVITVETVDQKKTDTCLITVIDKFGDMNSDGAVNILDLLWIFQLIGQEPVGEAVKADVDGDGEISNLDLLAVAQKIGN